MGYFDGAYKKTGVAAPGIVYLVYLFLGLVTAWQFLSFIIGTSFKRKLDASKGNQLPSISSENKVFLSGPPPQSLPTVDQKNMMANTVTEATTKNLDKAPRADRAAQTAVDHSDIKTVANVFRTPRY